MTTLTPTSCPCGCGKMIVGPLFGCQCSSLRPEDAEELARRYNTQPDLLKALRGLVADVTEEARSGGRTPISTAHWDAAIAAITNAESGT